MATHSTSSPAASPKPIFSDPASEAFVGQASEARGKARGSAPEAGHSISAAPPQLKPASVEADAVAKLVHDGPIGQRFEHLLKTIHLHRPTEDLAPIQKAWEFCLHYHAEQKRPSGEPYIIHPLEVAEVLAEMKLDATAIAAGLLHDAVEDTPVTSEEIATAFGEQV